MAFQMRSVATFRLANLVTGLTPGRLFQMSTSRLLSGPIKSANCSSVEKYARARLAGCLLGGVDGDVVFVIDRKVFHLRVISFCGKHRGDHIHHSEVLERQGNPPQIGVGEKLAMGEDGDADSVRSRPYERPRHRVPTEQGGSHCHVADGKAIVVAGRMVEIGGK